MSPEQFSIPGPPIDSFGKPQPKIGKAMHHGIGAACFCEEIEEQSDSPTDLLIRIENCFAFVAVAQADRKGGAQLASLGLVHLTPLEASAQEVKLGLGHRSL